MPVVPEQHSSAPYSSGPRYSHSFQAHVDICGLADKHMPFIHKPKVFIICVKLPPQMFALILKALTCKLKLLKEKCHILSPCLLVQSM